MERLKCAAYVLLTHYAGTVPETLDSLTSKERHSIYKMLRLRIVVSADGPMEITGVFGGPLEGVYCPFCETWGACGRNSVHERKPSLVLVSRNA